MFASNRNGYPLERYERMQAAWYIREVAMQIDGPISFGADVRVVTWVSNYRRFRSRREYLIEADGAVRARAQAEWLFLRVEPDSGKVSPFHFDEDMLRAFLRDPTTAIDRADALAFGGPVEPDHTMQRTAMPSSIDRYGHVNHVHYLAWVTDHLCVAGMNPRGLQRVRLQFLADVKAHDGLTLRLERNGDGARHEIVRDDERVARAVTSVVSIPQ